MTIQTSSPEGLATDAAATPAPVAAPAAAQALLTPSEVAALFRVDPKTVTRWAKAGKLTSIRTLGGHRRYRSAEVMALLEQVAPAEAALPAPRSSADDATA